MSLHVLEHSLVDHHLTALRDKETDSEQFRYLLQKLSTIAAIEATRDLAVESYAVETPIAEYQGLRLKRSLGLVPILRAGLTMVDPILNLVPHAEVWHLGLFRDEETATPVEYYCKIQDANPVDEALILDPMLATGGSASCVIEKLIGWGVKDIRLISIIASQAGVDFITTKYEFVKCFLCSVDPYLNDKKYIVPGLGDAGDRSFKTR